MQVSRFIKRALLCSRINQTQTALYISPFSSKFTMIVLRLECIVIFILSTAYPLHKQLG